MILLNNIYISWRDKSRGAPGNLSFVEIPAKRLTFYTIRVNIHIITRDKHVSLINMLPVSLIFYSVTLIELQENLFLSHPFGYPK